MMLSYYTSTTHRDKHTTALPVCTHAPPPSFCIACNRMHHAVRGHGSQNESGNLTMCVS